MIVQVEPQFFFVEVVPHFRGGCQADGYQRDEGIKIHALNGTHIGDQIANDVGQNDALRCNVTPQIGQLLCDGGQTFIGQDQDTLLADGHLSVDLIR